MIDTAVLCSSSESFSSSFRVPGVPERDARNLGEDGVARMFRAVIPRNFAVFFGLLAIRAWNVRNWVGAGCDEDS